MMPWWSICSVAVAALARAWKWASGGQLTSASTITLLLSACTRLITQEPSTWKLTSVAFARLKRRRGGQPRKKAIRDLGWVVPRWAGKKAPRVISMENVRQMMNWGPLIAKRDKETGRVIKLVEVNDKIIEVVAEPGERVPVQQQFLIPDPRYLGRTWRRFVAMLEGLGYRVETRVAPAANAGAATTRERLYMIARNDGCPIVWRSAQYHKAPKKGQKRWRPVAEVIDWSLPCPSIFLTKEQAKEFRVKRPLADATLKRIAIGVQRYVLGEAEPFIVELANWSGLGVNPTSQPLRTITGYPKGGAFAVCSPIVVKPNHTSSKTTYDCFRGQDVQDPLGVITTAPGFALAAPVMVRQFGQSIGHPITEPTGTITAGGGGKSQLVAPVMVQANGGFNTTHAHPVTRPATTITTTGSQQQLVTAMLAHLRNNMDCSGVDGPMPVITAGGQHHAVVEASLAGLSPEHEAGALRVAAFLMQYYSNGGQWSAIDKPCNTITTKERLALVTVVYQGQPYVIVDIGLRMLVPRELYRAQGFPDDYIITHGHDGRKFTITEQVKMVGNSVSPLPMAVIAEDNDPWKMMQEAVA
jgi:DNA (cytosine-5)-methyltransferase 1